MRIFRTLPVAALLALHGGCTRAYEPRPGQLVLSAGVASEAEAVVQAQVEAYNRRDLEGFLRHFDPEIRLYAFPDSLMFAGRDTLRSVYGDLFARATGLRAEVTRRTVQGRFVIDQETTFGMSSRGPLTGVAIYEVRAGRITRVWFLD